MMPLVINRSPTYLPSYHGKTHPSGPKFGIYNQDPSNVQALVPPKFADPSISQLETL